MRSSPFALVLLLVAAAVAVGVVLLASTAPSSCGDADASQESQLVAQAQRAYTAILSEDPDSACAIKGMRLVVRELCARGRTLDDRGATEQAEKVYGAVLAADLPDWNRKDAVHWNVGCALDGLEALATPTPSPAATATACACTGPAGPKGDTGAKGDDGATGDTGPKGDRGLRGRRGPKGDPGTCVGPDCGASGS
jgi:hypothetical protein